MIVGHNGRSLVGRAFHIPQLDGTTEVMPFHNPRSPDKSKASDRSVRPTRAGRNLSPHSICTRKFCPLP